MATVFDVAGYILGKKGPMTTMKLQKLVYYCQAWNLAWDEKPLFDENFQAWANGPVCPELFKKHKGKYVVDKADIVDHDFDFDQDEIETMDSVISFYGDKEPQWLSELVHKERPWKEARGNCMPGDRCTNMIPKETMQEYYSGLIQ